VNKPDSREIVMHMVGSCSMRDSTIDPPIHDTPITEK
jgi:hypothetical protein